jgi:hypothetical protein
MFEQNLFTPKHLCAARQLESGVSPSDTSYAHVNSDIQWQELNGKYVCHTDCSGLINAILQYSYGYSSLDYLYWLGKERPKARHYFDAIYSQKKFKKIECINDLMPGDILAMRFLPQAQDAAHDSGHIMIVNEYPKLHEISIPLIENTKQWTVSVIDCTRQGHGTLDSRYRGYKQFKEGIGNGPFRIYSDLNDQIIGYAWSPSRYALFYGSDQRPLVAGRLDLES